MDTLNLIHTHVSNTNELIFIIRKEKQSRETGGIQTEERNKMPKEIRKKNFQEK